MSAAAGTSGKLKMKRTGNTMEGFYWDGAEWQLVGSYTDPSLGWATSVGLSFDRDTPFSGPSVQAAFDKIQVTYTALNWTIFESFDNTTYDQDSWFLSTQGQGPATAVANNRLEISIPANASAGGNPYPFGGNIGSRFEMLGDFEVQVDFDLPTWPAPTGVQVGLGPTLMRGSFPAGVWLMSDPTYSPPQVYEAYLNGTDNKIGTADSSGKLRLTRTGLTMQAFYWSAGGWQLIASRTDPLFGATCGITMYALSHNFQGKAVKVAFDNIQVIYNKIRPFGTRNSTAGALQMLLQD